MKGASFPFGPAEFWFGTFCDLLVSDVQRSFCDPTSLVSPVPRPRVTQGPEAAGGRPVGRGLCPFPSAPRSPAPPSSPPPSSRASSPFPPASTSPRLPGVSGRVHGRPSGPQAPSAGPRPQGATGSGGDADPGARPGRLELRSWGRLGGSRGGPRRRRGRGETAEAEPEVAPRPDPLASRRAAGPRGGCVWAGPAPSPARAWAPLPPLAPSRLQPSPREGAPPFDRALRPPSRPTPLSPRGRPHLPPGIAPTAPSPAACSDLLPSRAKMGPTQRLQAPRSTAATRLPPPPVEKREHRVHPRETWPNCWGGAAGWRDRFPRVED